MPLEDLVGPNKYLDALNRNWPLDSDTASEGNDHISGHKNVVLNTFPGPNGNGLEEAVHVERSALFVDNGNGTDRQGALEMAVGSTAQRPANGDLTKGDTRWNVTTDRLETWDGSAWIELHAMAALTSMFRAKQNLEADSAALVHVSSDEAVAYTRVLGTILDATAGSEEGALIFEAITSGALAEALRVIGAGVSSPGYHKRDGTDDIPLSVRELVDSVEVANNQADVVISWDKARGYRRIDVEAFGLQPASGNSSIMELEFSTNGGSSWLAGSYFTNGNGQQQGGGISTGAQNQATGRLTASGSNMAFAAASANALHLRALNLGGGGRAPSLFFDHTYVRGTVWATWNGGIGWQAAAEIDAMRIALNNENFAAAPDVQVIGYR